MTSSRVEFTYTFPAAAKYYPIECERLLFTAEDAAEPSDT